MTTAPIPDGRTQAPAPPPASGRLQLALNVDDLDAAVAFYSTLFGTSPAKQRPGYANFARYAAAAQAGPAREPRQGRHVEPPRRRGAQR